ncbi:2-amino-4-deoxychorismate synthase [Mixta theicola]|uniref:2-amino-4-deoxychorismate synthase n=1 Tax=Mixta theicola TaxID=1458355 RepID=A0A2K1Q6L7_9GAMM|nr:anthranilate synthase component I family protein [Mixta theicola]PNS10675.1 2-amino-4-deoxychorismate synthase [Mixta theicola]GLR10936.1 anthranilate synthase component I [Mixta theicola]
MTYISVSCKSENISVNNDPVCIYNKLRKKYGENEIFLLESMSGPEKDCNKSIIAFEPIFTLKINEYDFSFTGVDSVVDFVSRHDALSSFAIKGHEGVLSSGQDLIRLLRAIENVFSVENINNKSDVKFGFFGYFGYDTVFYFEDIDKVIKRDKGIATIHLSIYRAVINIDIRSKKTLLVLNDSDYFSELNEEDIINLINDDEVTYEFNSNFSASSVAHPTVSVDEYYAWFDIAKGHIDIGNVYQIQLGHEIRIDSDIKPYDVYLRMREYNPSPYMYYFKTSEDVYVIGASPEMFITLTGSKDIFMRPIAGTIKNSTDLQEKERNRRILLSDEKEGAEHLMLVDLCRNDIARICVADSLKVDELLVTEEYSHVIHIVSHVRGILTDEYDKYDILAATFPAGTMTGTPKIKAVEIIENTEINPRGIYAGCIGYFGFDDVMISALCIRTAIYKDGMYIIRASGGIVEDSTKKGEWDETINKLSSTYLAITDKELRNEIFVS